MKWVVLALMAYQTPLIATASIRSQLDRAAGTITANTTSLCNSFSWNKEVMGSKQQLIFGSTTIDVPAPKK
jgi:hypothetical protein